MPSKILLLFSSAFLFPSFTDAASLELQAHTAGRPFDMTGNLTGMAAKDAPPTISSLPTKLPEVVPGPVVASTPKPQEDRRYLLDRVGEIGFLQLYIDGFEKLPLNQKILAYHLSQAALAGRNIIFDQTHRHALEIKDLLEQILSHGQKEDPNVLRKIRSYFLLFCANHGNYDIQNNEKFAPEFTPEELHEAARAAAQDGAFQGMGWVELDTQLEKLKASIFDLKSEPLLINRIPNQDHVAASAVNFYQGITQKEAEEHDQGKPYPVVDRLVKEGDAIRKETYRAGDPARGIPPGKYAEQLVQVVAHLEKALPYAASPKQKQSLEHLIAFFKSGDPADFKEYNRIWTHDDSPVDAILGFIETYMDPMERRASFEGMISFKDPNFTSVIQSVAKTADYFEKAAPWETEYKKDKVVPITANAVNMITQSGDAGAKLVLGVNLPNDGNLRQTEGSKNIMISNALESVDAYMGAKEMAEFAWNKRELALYQKWASKSYRIHVALHEAVGHASGKVSDKLHGQAPSVFLKEYSSALEEARAELFALWAIADPKLKTRGLVDDPKIVEVSYRSFVTKGGLIQLSKYQKAERLTQAHARARNLIAMYLLKKTRAVEVKEREGKVYLRVTNLNRMRQGVSELLGKLMRIKAEGDYAGAKALFDEYGDPINAAWRDQVVDRRKKLDMPTRVIPISAQLKLVLNPDGDIADVLAQYPETVDEVFLGQHAPDKTKKLPLYPKH